MGQPDMIYKFMDLANYQASLNSKRGAAFGFSKIAKHAGDALQPHLHALVPRLLRYQYDPDKNVQVLPHKCFCQADFLCTYRLVGAQLNDSPFKQPLRSFWLF